MIGLTDSTLRRFLALGGAASRGITLLKPQAPHGILAVLDDLDWISGEGLSWLEEGGDPFSGLERVREGQAPFTEELPRRSLPSLPASPPSSPEASLLRETPSRGETRISSPSPTGEARARVEARFQMSVDGEARRPLTRRGRLEAPGKGERGAPIPTSTDPSSRGGEARRAGVLPPPPQGSNLPRLQTELHRTSPSSWTERFEGGALASSFHRPVGGGGGFPLLGPSAPEERGSLGPPPAGQRGEGLPPISTGASPGSVGDRLERVLSILPGRRPATTVPSSSALVPSSSSSPSSGAQGPSRTGLRGLMDRASTEGGGAPQPPPSLQEGLFGSPSAPPSSLPSLLVGDEALTTSLSRVLEREARRQGILLRRGMP